MPGTKPMPSVKADVKRANEISELTEVSNIQMMKGISKNMIKPLARCMPDTDGGQGPSVAGQIARMR